ncbi:MAG: 16S rRNA processing protein RimM [Nitrospinae bacterium]|nr:16S rRNA processing protein RimM [Nitrospinota bacterium]
MTIEKIVCGKFLKPFGVRGEIKFLPYYPDQLDVAALTGGVLRHPSSKATAEAEVFLVSARPLSGGIWAVRPDGCETPEFARQYTNAELLVSRSFFAPAKDGENLPFDIIENTVFDHEGKKLGVVQDIFITGANDVWEVLADDGREILVPAVKEVVLSVEPGKIVVKLPNGLLD